MENLAFIARYRQSDGTPQPLKEHLEGVADLAELFAGKIGMPTFGALLGLLHDTGKYSKAFQDYIKSAGGMLEPDDDEYIEVRKARGKIDHSSAGSQFVWRESGKSTYQQLAANILALCIASHHSGLIDCLSPDGTDIFSKRMIKADNETHYSDAVAVLEDEIKTQIKKLLESPALEKELKAIGERMKQMAVSVTTGQFALGFLTRFLFSALIDADRLNSAERTTSAKPDWNLLCGILEVNLAGFTVRNKIDTIRADISQACRKSAEREKGLYQLTVPTGGGKTLASLRFALYHAAKYGMDRIIYVVPFTSIIDQNARVARSIFAFQELTGKPVVLEHHSNLTPEQDTSESKLLTENWDAPIIYTTAVQFLETLFAGGTRGVRRLHQLANAVIIFDEIQTIPIRTIHLFNNAINFLVNQCGSTAVFCTATQPLLDRVDLLKGAAILSENPEMMGTENVDELFLNLHRARIEDRCKDGGWTVDDIADEAMKELADSGSVLVIVNKKSQAKELYTKLKARTDQVYHLSTSMCPAHRIRVLDKIKACLDPDKPQPVICVSTQLIEAGVDVDFGSVIRYLAGLDSIAQAAGRCNRNGRRETGRVLIVNQAGENLDRLPEMKVAQEITRRVLREFRDDPMAFDENLQSPRVMERYYFYYFFNRSHEMAFPVSSRNIRGMTGTSDLLTLLSTNNDAVQIYMNTQRNAPTIPLRQAFMSAAEAFRVIDSPTEGVIVPYMEGERIVAKLMTCPEEDRARLLKEAQRYSVNLFPHEMKKLKDTRALTEVWAGSGVFYLDERHYSEEFGISSDAVAEMKVRII
ncbi:CRISPR-associated helicase Cas3' [Trichlorobacter ammonificans]|uniref:CRISPR-associated helicase Cas3 n=1 Tax=Trichlorobacter ammonificans TaxID=2916410 RepID=A0ABM9D650_9BACT|nr:CRISPR-associated helicase Cas3' [Trichlorobacter ammonificans]CAH2030722.1 CRISPR-associated helicase Cas3 [Trichlorobacter ammonificans]